jgi:spore maturation protein A
MMNYIWAGLILLAMGFAVWGDASDITSDRYANGRPLPATIEFPPVSATDARTIPVTVRIDPAVYASHFNLPGVPKTWTDLTGEFVDREVRITSPTLPAPLSAIRAFHDEADKVLRAAVLDLTPDAEAPTLDGQSIPVRLEFQPVRLVKLKAITTAAFEFSKTAVTLALGFIGIFALWMGLMKIAEVSGLIEVFVRLVQPFLRLLFPEVPKGHPALGMIAMNLSANMLGLGNAATPMGLKAMEELQKLNPKPDTATNPMVMLLAMNTAGVQLLPSATLVAVMGLQSTAVFIPILVVTGISLVFAIVVTRLLGRLPGNRRTDPNRSNHPETQS